MNRSILNLCIGSWMLSVAAGLYILLVYEYTAGLAQVAPSAWPAESSVQKAADTFTLVMLLHPHCACSQASLDELAVIMARTQGRLESKLLFFSPDGKEDGWSHGALWKQANTIPGVTTIDDPNGSEAELFQAATSGHVALYSPKGKLLFSGGITPSRAHSGSNAGRSAIIAAVHRQQQDRAITPVFGCEIFDPETSEGEGV